MSLQINLYNPAFVPKREWLTPKSVALGTLASLLAVAGWGGWARYAETTRSAHLVAAQAAQKQAQEGLDALRRATAARAPSAALTADIAQRKQRLANGETVLSVLQGGSQTAGGGGFAGYLGGLARQHVNGLWLTRFSVTSGGAGMTVQGRALDQSLVASYVSRLKAEKAFSGIAFADIKVLASGPSASATPVSAVPPAPTLVPAPATPAVAIPAPQAATPVRGDPGPALFHEFQLTAVRALDTAAPAAAPPPAAPKS